MIYRRFGGSYCLHLEGEAVQADNWCLFELLELEDWDIRSLEASVNLYPKTAWRIRRLESSQASLWGPQISQHAVISHKTLGLWVIESRSVDIVTGFLWLQQRLVCEWLSHVPLTLLQSFYGYRRGLFVSDWGTFRVHCYSVLWLQQMLVSEWLSHVPFTMLPGFYGYSRGWFASDATSPLSLVSSVMNKRRVGLAHEYCYPVTWGIYF